MTSHRYTTNQRFSTAQPDGAPVSSTDSLDLTTRLQLSISLRGTTLVEGFRTAGDDRAIVSIEMPATALQIQADRQQYLDLIDSLTAAVAALWPYTECPTCTSPITQAGTGRPRTYCSDACRKMHDREVARNSAYTAAVHDIHAAGFEIGTAG